MKIQELMTRQVQSCHRDTRLSDAARIMWDNDCGSIPVVDDEDRVVGLITDRDICMAVAMHNAPPDDMTVGEVARRKPITVTAEDDTDRALTAMKTNRIHRLAVVDKQGHLEGIFSMTDAVRASRRPAKGKQIPLEADQLVDVLNGIRTRPTDILERREEPKTIREKKP